MRQRQALSTQVPGGYLCHPVALLALATLLLNDHVLKGWAPGLITGKLSDGAGLVLFPLVLAAAVEFVAVAARRPRPSRKWLLLVAIGATAGVFIAVKTLPAATEAYNAMLGGAQWFFAGGPLTNAARFATVGVTDPTDLIALPALAVPYWVATGHPFRLEFSGPRRASAMSLTVLIVAGLASLATSPPIRSSSAEYEEVITLTQAAPVVSRHLSISITNREATLREIVMLAGGYSVDPNRGRREPGDGVLVSLVPDLGTQGRVGPANTYFAAGLSFLEVCQTSCETGATVVVRLSDPAALTDGQGFPTKLAVDLTARASNEESGPVDIDLVMRHDAERAFQGEPDTLVASHTGSFHVGADEPRYEMSFEITIDAEALQEPYGYPLIGQISVGVEHETAVGDPFAHSTSFAFDSPALPSDVSTYDSVAVVGGWEDRPPAPPEVLDLAPLCVPGEDCRIAVTLTSQYDPTLNEPDSSADQPVAGSIVIDWFVELRLEAFDGRQLPEGALRFEPAN